MGAVVEELAGLEKAAEEIEEEIQRVQTNIDIMERQSIDAETYKRLFRQFGEMCAELNFEEQRNLIMLLVREVIYTPSHMTIKFWGDLKDIDLRAVKKNSQTGNGVQPVFVWECKPTPRATLPNENLFQIGFPLFLCNIRRGEHRISINPIEIQPIPPKAYPNPLLIALQYKRLLETPEIGSQTALARKVGVSRARISQFLRLLKLPQDIQQTVIKMGDPLSSQAMTERKLRALISTPQPR